MLDHEGAEVVLIGADEDPSAELGIELNAQHETAATAEIFRNLRLERRPETTKPLLEGKWR